MVRPSNGPMLAVLALNLAAGCNHEVGEDGTEISMRFEQLSGGIIFASKAIRENNQYDLLWVPAPRSPTTNPQPVLRVTHAEGNEWQPSVSQGGKGIAFVRENDGIHFISTSGRITRISDTRGTKLKDSLPAVSFDGKMVAWVREDTSRPIGQTGFSETYVMVANSEGKLAHPIDPRSGLIQDAPVFEPREGATQIAWSVFDATTLTGIGPTTYGIYVHDLVRLTGSYVCREPAMDVPNMLGHREAPYRCFGQHLAWIRFASGDPIAPVDDYIVTGQDLLEVNITRGRFSTIWPQIVLGLQSQQSGTPVLSRNAQGFFGPFPLSVSYGDDRLVLDGLISPTDGDAPTLGLFIADLDGGNVWRLQVDGLFSDYDPGSTSNFFFSVATPQLVP